MNRLATVALGLLCALGADAALMAQARPTLVVVPFTTAKDVQLPYDLKQLQGQLVAEFKVMLGKDFEVVPDLPTADPGAQVYQLNGEISEWRPGNAAKRMFVGMGSGRESIDLRYHILDKSGAKVLEQKDTIRTNFYSQNASTGTLGHPIAQKITERIKNAKLH